MMQEHISQACHVECERIILWLCERYITWMVLKGAAVALPSGSTRVPYTHVDRQLYGKVVIKEAECDVWGIQVLLENVN